jgi:hypothetical protein
MDKIIKHHFWGVVVLALALPPLAWNMTAGELETEFQDRQDALEASFKSIPKGNGAPNDDWINGAQERIDIRKTTNAQSVDRLWQTQKQLITWPGSISKYMVNCPYPWGANPPKEKRGELPQGTDAQNRILQVTPDLYKQEYASEVRRVWMIAEPRDDKENQVDSSQRQKVHFPFAVLPQRDLANRPLPPTWMEIWSAQEDLWLLSQILGAVRDVNASTTSITDSYLKQIEQLELYGGKRTLPNQVAQAAAKNANAAPGGAGAVSSGSSTTAKPRSPVFSLAEEYDAVGIATSSGRSQGGPMGPSAAMPGTTQPGTTASAAKDPNTDENRYIAKEAAYRTRGFRIKVVIHQRAVPDFIAELLGSEYPIEITRFELAALNPDTAGGNSTTTGNTPFMAGGGGPLGAGPKLGADLSAGAPMPTDGGGDGAFDLGNEGGGGGGVTSAPVNDAAAAAALKELDMMSLVVVGELYLYNPPQKKEQDNAGGATNSGTPAATPGTTPAPVTPGTTPAVTTPGTTPAPVTPGTTPAPTTPGTTPAPVTPGTTPAVTTPAPVTPGTTPAATTPGTTPTPVTPGKTPAATTPGTNPAPVTPGTTPAATTPGTAPGPKTPGTTPNNN